MIFFPLYNPPKNKYGQHRQKQIYLTYILRILFASIFISFLPAAHAQDYTVHVQQFGVEEGLLHRDIMSVFEDRVGFIWIGSSKGLQRYDGHEFKSWTKSDRTGLIYYISNIQQDDEGWLWLWNNDLLRLVFFHPETEEILTYEERFGGKEEVMEKSIPRGPISPRLGMLTDQMGRIVFEHTDNSRILAFSSTKGFEYLEPKILSSLKIHLIDNQNHIWGSTPEGHIFKFDFSGNVLEDHQLEHGSTIFQIAESEGNFFITSGSNKDFPQKLLRWRTKDEPHELKEISSPLSEIVGNTFWVSNEEGWKIYSLENMALNHVLGKKEYDKKLFELTTNPYIDSKDRVWIYGELGLNKIVIRPSRFRNYLSFKENETKSFNNSARGILVEKDTLYVNCEFTGTFKLNNNTPDEWTIIQKKEGNPRPILLINDQELLIGSSKTLRHIKTDGTIIQNYYPVNSISGLWSFYQNQEGKLWIGEGSQLVYKNKGEGTLKIYQPPEDPFGFTKRRGAIQNMIPSKNGLVWFCSWTGLYLFDPINEKILARYASDETDEHFLPAKIFYYLYEDQEGVRWLGTSEGLIRWAPDKNGQPTHQLFTRKEGLSNDVIYAIFEDNHNRLWMSSDYGIMSFDKSTFDIHTYLKKDGISHEEFNRTSQFKASDGTIYFGGLNGITSFHPDDFVQPKKEYARMLISDFEIFDGQQGQLVNKTGNLRQTSTIVFHPKDRYFKLKFTLPTFDEASKNLYAWKIDGVYDEWNYQKENALQLASLPYGDYVLTIKGQGEKGGWSPHELKINLKVPRPFYLQYWFIALANVVLLGGIYLFYKRRTQNYKRTQRLLQSEITKATSQIQTDKSIIEKQAEELRQLDKVKSRFFANVSHELRTPLTLILGPIGSVLKSNELSNRNFTHLKKAQQNGKELLKLVASILDLSKMESGKLEVHNKPELLFQLTRRIAAAFESHAQRSGIEFIFDYLAEKGLQLKLDKEKVETILNNLLSNAIKFTPSGGKVVVTTEDLAHSIRLSVADTGRGIHPNDLPNVFNRFYQAPPRPSPKGREEGPSPPGGGWVGAGGTGIGLALCQELVKVMDGKIWVESELGKGSTFFVELPRKEVMGSSPTASPSPALPKGEGERSSLKTEETGDRFSFPTSSGKGLTPPPLEGAGGRLLIVEDNHSLRDYIESILSPYYHVITAENGQAALELLGSSPFGGGREGADLILSDIMMPVMDGFQLLEKLKSDDRYRHLPVIMLTARADMQDKLKALRIGVDDYLLKPFDEEELLVRIENLLQNAEERKVAIELVGDSKRKTQNAKLISQADQEWLISFEEDLKKQLANPNYSIAQMADDFAMSQSTLSRQLKRLTGLTPARYFQELRLNEARQLLENRAFKTISEVAYGVGFSDAPAFNRAFKKRFGKAPTEIIS